MKTLTDRELEALRPPVEALNRDLAAIFLAHSNKDRAQILHRIIARAQNLTVLAAMMAGAIAVEGGTEE